jgi:glutathione S-transferase
MKLYAFQGACSLGIHLLLNEVGATYDLIQLDARAGDLQKPEFKAINPKTKVPVLVLDNGETLTEWPAIASYIAAAHPDHHLLSGDPLTAARTLEAVLYINSTLHVAGFARIVRPMNFAPDAAHKDAVRAQGKQIFADGFALISATLGDKPYLMGDFSIADAALFYVTYWNKALPKLNLPANIDAHYDRMMSRPAVLKAMQTEGLA